LPYPDRIDDVLLEIERHQVSHTERSLTGSDCNSYLGLKGAGPDVVIAGSSAHQFSGNWTSATAFCDH
jgi:hypothetical protein